MSSKTSSKTLNFAVEEPDGLSREAEPVRCSFALADGEFSASDGVHVIDASDGREVDEAVIDVRSTWPGGHIGWIGIELPVTVEANGRRDYALVAGSGTAASERPLEAADDATGGSFTLKFGSIDAFAMSPVSSGARSTENELHLRVYVIDEKGSRQEFDFHPAADGTPGDRRRRIESTPPSPTSDLAGLNLAVTFDVHPRAGLVDVELGVHNPAAAHHGGGLWDAGDPASILFQEVGLEIAHREGRSVSAQCRADGEALSIDAMSTLRVEQLSSPVERVSAAARQAAPCGFSVLADDAPVASGSRVSPVGIVAFDDGTLSTHVPLFWQEYPSALRLTKATTTIALFAKSENGPHELQPGERKRRELSLQLGRGHRPSGRLASRLEVSGTSGSIALSAEHFHRALVPRGRFEKTLASLVVSPDAFLAKREVIDEYGWRNFGDVFADHESLYLRSDEPPFVSHYNNQYDLVLGFGLQYLRTRDTRWRDLMNDLARHVVDIDIYHTVKDRVEYNHGLFWHTNHYQDAGAATHRTFSAMNYDPADPSGSSGGPGPEHCYTSGLALHYLLSGDPASRAAVIGLARWIREYFRGDGTLAGQAYSVAKRELPNIVGLVRRRRGSPYAYPLTRATGNLIVAFLDAYLLSGSRAWLDDVEGVIVDTFHPDDDIDARRLDDVETTWSHTIFLQAVLRYLAVKEALGEEDAAYEHARRAFIAYSRWTLDSAKPYLERPETLEFANDTWAAQDIRRHVLMMAAAFYDETNEEAYLRKADELGDHVTEVLRDSETRHFSRIQAIILQNLGMGSLFVGRARSPSVAPGTTVAARRQLTVAGELQRATAKLVRGLRGFDVRAELQWLRTRR